MVPLTIVPYDPSKAKLSGQRNYDNGLKSLSSVSMAQNQSPHGLVPCAKPRDVYESSRWAQHHHSKQRQIKLRPPWPLSAPKRNTSEQAGALAGQGLTSKGEQQPVMYTVSTVALAICSMEHFFQGSNFFCKNSPNS